MPEYTNQSVPGEHSLFTAHRSAARAFIRLPAWITVGLARSKELLRAGQTYRDPGWQTDEGSCSAAVGCEQAVLAWDALIRVFGHVSPFVWGRAGDEERERCKSIALRRSVPSSATCDGWLVLLCVASSWCCVVFP